MQPYHNIIITKEDTYISKHGDFATVKSGDASKMAGESLWNVGINP